MWCRVGGVGSLSVYGGCARCEGMPAPDSNWPLDILDVDFAAVMEASVDSIADALVDNRGDANAARLCNWFKSRCDVYAIAVDVIAFDNHVAQIDANAKNDRW